MKREAVCLAVAAAGVVSQDALGQAQLQVFLSKAEFVARVCPNDGTGGLPAHGSASSFAVGSFTFTAATAPNSLSCGPYSARIPGNSIVVGGVENMDISVVQAVHAFGLEMVEPRLDPGIQGPFEDSTFTLTLVSAGVELGSFTFQPPNDALSFVGVLSDEPFDTVRVRETAGGAENEFFGPVYSSSVESPWRVEGPRDTFTCFSGFVTFRVDGGLGGVPYMYRWQWRPEVDGGAWVDLVESRNSNAAGVELVDAQGVTSAELRVSPLGAYNGGAPREFRAVVSNACGSAETDAAVMTVCGADFNCDSFVDFFDASEFVAAFEAGDDRADYNGDGFLDFFDADAFVAGFEEGC